MKVGDWFNMFTGNSGNSINSVKNTKNNLEAYIPTWKPKNFDNTIPEKEIPRYKKATLEENYDFFANIADGNFNFSKINGVSLQYEFFEKCSFCKLTFQESYPFRICTYCDKIMCALCWEEKTEEDAKRQFSKNWHKRKDELLNCFSHQDFIFKKELLIYCDNCNVSSLFLQGTWRCDRVNNIDFCPECAKLKDCSEYVNVEYYDIDGLDINFGSILDWIILFSSDTENILYNINKDSELYHKLAILRENEISVLDKNLEEFN